MLEAHLWRWGNAKVCILCNAILRAAAMLGGKKQAGQQGGNEGQETRVKFGEELIAGR